MTVPSISNTSFRSLIKIVSINYKTIEVKILFICSYTIITLNVDVIPIMFYGVLITRNNPVLIARVNKDVYSENMEDLIIKRWELPDFDGTDYHYAIIFGLKINI